MGRWIDMCFMLENLLEFGEWEESSLLQMSSNGHGHKDGRPNIYIAIQLRGGRDKIRGVMEAYGQMTSSVLIILITFFFLDLVLRSAVALTILFLPLLREERTPIAFAMEHVSLNIFPHFDNFTSGTNIHDAKR